MLLLSFSWLNSVLAFTVWMETVLCFIGEENFGCFQPFAYYRQFCNEYPPSYTSYSCVRVPLGLIPNCRIGEHVRLQF